ncbi:MAG: hypothetical protein NTU97_01105 [Candidatus Magasanikbacteria bacterium]|nr:hypothetical protein [Candidatus Magasanikbacteria bacterium]
MPPRKTSTTGTTTPRSRRKKVIVESEINVPPFFEPVEESSGVGGKTPIVATGEFYPTPRFYRTIALSFLSVAVILILGVFYFTLGKAEINLFLKPKNIKIDFLLGVGDKAEGQNKIPGLVVSTVLNGEKVIPVEASGEDVMGTPSPAVGKVIIYNQTNKDQTLVATTRLLSPDNVLFRMKKNLVVPANGSVESDVYADKPGLGGEIEPTKFSIPGLSLELQKVIFAESKEKMVGGVKVVKKLTEEAINAASDPFVKELVERGKEQMIKINATSSLDSYVFTYTVTSIKTDAKAGQEVANFKITAEVKLTGIFYSSKELNKVLGVNLRSSLNENEVVVGTPSVPQVEFSKIGTAGSAELKVTQEASAQVSYLEDVIDKNKILGQKKAVVEEYFSSLPWIERAEIKLSPSWIMSIPKEMGKVKININQ